jgi:predicted DNA-binding transcriptional regulator AlpA
MGRTQSEIAANRDRLARPEEIAEYLGTAVANLAKWRYEKSGPPYHRCGRLIRYRWAEVDAWLDARTVVATGGTP